jgi:hypothetical protein
MRTAISVLATIITLSFAGCAAPTGTGGMPPDSPDAGTPPPPPPPPPVDTGVTGKWSGSFTSDSSLASKGDFTFDLTENMTTHAVTGGFIGTVTAGATGTAFKGTFTGSRSAALLTGSAAISEPAGVTGTFGFHDAAISGSNGGDTIAGMFNINVMYSGLPITAMGGYTIKRAP